MKQESKNAVRTGVDLTGINRFRTLIADSWKRCENSYGLERYTSPKVNVLDSMSTRLLQEECEEFLRISQAECQQLYEQTCRTGSIVALTNNDSVILKTFGDSSTEEDFKKSYLIPGAIWSEEHQGTNGMGTSIKSNKLVNVHKSDHFFQRYQDLTCISAPIHDHEGRILGALDITTLNPEINPEEQQYTCDLVQAATNYIEYQYFQTRFRETPLLHFHPRRESLQRGSEGLIALDSDNRIIAVNERSLFFLKARSRETLLGKNVNEIFELADSALEYEGHDHSERRRETAVFGRENGRRYIAQLTNQSAGIQKNRTSVIFTSSEESAMDQEKRNLSAFSFEKLSGSDPTMKNICERIKRVLDKEINIMITGETGTGKEEFARTIHTYSKLSDRPFIYLNCSGLTEPELFVELIRSYESDQKSGHNHDAVGTMLEPFGAENQERREFSCTVFLDQVSDLSPVLQQDLLHILQTGQITVPETTLKVTVDWQIISSDCQPLHTIVDENLVRPELYYRLNGINFRLPSIKDREDKEALIQEMLRLENNAVRSPHLSKRATQTLLDYDWPGNFRELKTVLKTATAMSDGRLIQLADLPNLRTHRYDESAMHKPVDDQNGHADSIGESLTPVELAEREAIMDALEECHWNMSRATSVLKMSRSTLYRKIKKYEIEVN